MTTTINAATSTGLAISSDGSGVVKLQSNGVTTNALAWVSFNGNSPATIRSSYNVSSVTRNGSGDYTVSLTNAIADANYAVVTGAKQDDTYNDRFMSVKVVNTSSFRMYFAAYSIGSYDATYAYAAVFGN